MSLNAENSFAIYQKAPETPKHGVGTAPQWVSSQPPHPRTFPGFFLPCSHVWSQELCNKVYIHILWTLYMLWITEHHKHLGRVLTIFSVIHSVEVKLVPLQSLWRNIRSCKMGQAYIETSSDLDCFVHFLPFYETKLNHIHVTCTLLVVARLIMFEAGCEW